MHLVRLVYTSTICNGFGSSDVESIILSARTKNAANDITGLLCFNSNIFLQCLEGSREKVNLLYQRILHDERHKNVIMLSYEEIIEREYSDWSMGYVPDSSLTQHVNLKYSGNKIFDPYTMSAKSSHRLMCDLKKTIPTHS